MKQSVVIIILFAVFVSSVGNYIDLSLTTIVNIECYQFTSYACSDVHVYYCYTCGVVGTGNLSISDGIHTKLYALYVNNVYGNQSFLEQSDGMSDYFSLYYNGTFGNLNTVYVSVFNNSYVDWNTLNTYDRNYLRYFGGGPMIPNITNRQTGYPHVYRYIKSPPALMTTIQFYISSNISSLLVTSTYNFQLHPYHYYREHNSFPKEEQYCYYLLNLLYVN